MLNNKLIKLICLVLALVLSISLLGACVKIDKENVSSNGSSSTTDEDDATSEPDDDSDNDSDNDEEDQNDESDDTANGDDEWGDDENEKGVFKYTVQNGGAPLIDSYRGMSATVYHANNFVKNDKTGRFYTDEMLDIEITRLQKMGVRTCRTRLYSNWIWSETTGNWDFNSERANYFYDYCKELQSRDMNIILNLGWDVEFVVEVVKDGQDAMTEVKYLDGRGDDINGESVGYDFTGLNEYWTRVTKAGLRYADYYAKFLTELKSRGINNVDYLLYFTEPSNRNADGSYHPFGAGSSAEQYVKLCRVISDALDKTGAVQGIKSIGACQGGANDGLLRYVLEHDPDLFDIMGSHHYPTATSIVDNVYYEVSSLLWERYMDAMDGAGFFGKKEFWCDEYAANDGMTKRGEPDTDPWYGLQAVVGLIASQAHGISNTISWQAADQLWTDTTYSEGEFRDGIHMCGAMPSLYNSIIPRGEYYMWGLFSKYNGYQNGKVFLTDYTEDDKHIYSGLHIGVVQLEDGNWTISVANVDQTDTTFVLNFEKALGKTLYRHTESVAGFAPDAQAVIADVDKVYVDVQDKLTDVIPAASLVVYTSVKG